MFSFSSLIIFKAAVLKSTSSKFDACVPSGRFLLTHFVPLNVPCFARLVVVVVCFVILLLW